MEHPCSDPHFHFTCDVVSEVLFAAALAENSLLAFWSC